METTIRRRWAPDPGWTGTWELPDVLRAPPTDDERRMLVELACAGVGPGRIVRELELTGSIERARDRIRAPHDARTAIGMLERTGARALTPADEEYPAVLREISAPPPLMFVRGQRLDTLLPCVAVVGCRAPTGGGARFAHRLAARLTEAGFTVVSGLARGIDAAAHEGALEAGSTVAVLGTGIDRVYPPEHASLADWIVTSGCVVSEFAPGTGPRAWHFPARNRLIAGLAMATIVVEAGERSGALITADLAVDQGREVMACIVSPTSSAGAGVRKMLRDGAPMVIDPDHALEHLVPLALAQGFTAHRPDQMAERTVTELDGEAKLVYDAVSEGTTPDEVVAATGLGIGRVMALLSELEVKGVVCEEGPDRYTRSQ
jgi:DNA processing protein